MDLSQKSSQKGSDPSLLAFIYLFYAAKNWVWLYSFFFFLKKEALQLIHSVIYSFMNIYWTSVMCQAQEY